jgi:chemotaxis protein methyltransferase CheR
MHALTRAMEGRYREADMKPLTRTERTYFDLDGGFWCPTKKLRSCVEFRPHNLVLVPFPTLEGEPWDVIFCRNVLIYFSREAIRGTIQRFHEILSPEGYLLLGSSESLFKLADGFELQSAEKAYVYRKSVTSMVPPRTVAQKVTYRQPKVLTDRASTPQQQHREARPSIGAALRNAQAMAQQGDQQGAFRLLFELTREYPHAVDPYRALGKLATDRGSLEEAMSWYLVAVELAPLETESRFLLAVVMHRAGRDQEAAEELRKLLFLDGRLSLGHYYLGVVASQLGDIETSLRSFRNVVRIAGAGEDTSAALLASHNLTLNALVSASREKMKRLGRETGRNGRTQA